ncbi:MAG: HTH domain-containing protein [Burkholderiales bacterium]|nr:HTH domain-containing protein [Burkholderiales bacterium]
MTITAKLIATELGITIRAVEKNIALLKEAGKLKRIGSTKSGSWHIL